MAVQRIAAVAAGAGFTGIFATIPLHYLKVYPDGDRTAAAMEYKIPDDNFVATYTADLGDIIERLGPGRHGLLGHPAQFTRTGQTATELLRIRFADAAARNIVVFESETNL